MSYETCKRCDGSGSITCSHCNGKGGWGKSLFDMAITLSEYEWTECTKCEGTGKQKCPNCNGSGSIYVNG